MDVKDEGDLPALLRGHSQPPNFISLEKDGLFLSQLKSLFRDFMQLVLVLDDLHVKGGALLVDFVRELEVFRSERVDKASALVAHVLSKQRSEALQRYLQCGCRRPLAAAATSLNIHELVKALHSHLEEAQENAGNLYRLFVRAENLLSSRSEPPSLVPPLPSALRGTTSIRCLSFKRELNANDAANPTVEMGQQDKEGIALNQPEEHKVPEMSHSLLRNLKYMDYLSMMTCIWGMVESDMTFKEKVVADLGLETRSEHLQSHSMLWSLRPFIDELVVSKAVSWL